MHRCTLESVHLSEEQAGTGSYSLHLPCFLHTSSCLLVQQVTGVSLHTPGVQHDYLLNNCSSRVTCLCRL